MRANRPCKDSRVVEGVPSTPPRIVAGPCAFYSFPSPSLPSILSGHTGTCLCFSSFLAAISSHW